MALPHALPGQPVDIRPLGDALAHSASHAILKTHALELMRIVLRHGQELPPHAVYGECTLLCIEGAVQVEQAGSVCELRADQVVLLPARGEHAVRALEDSSLLLTVQLPPGAPGSGSSTQ
jgi:quercetin dioxygenase-like cupin family protein